MWDAAKKINKIEIKTNPTPKKERHALMRHTIFGQIEARRRKMPATVLAACGHTTSGNNNNKLNNNNTSNNNNNSNIMLNVNNSLCNSIAQLSDSRTNLTVNTPTACQRLR